MKSGNLAFEAAIRAVESAFDVPRKDILGRSRIREFVRPRQAVMVVALDLLGGTALSEVGRLFGQHHTTVYWSAKRVADLAEDDAEFGLLVAFCKIDARIDYEGSLDRFRAEVEALRAVPCFKSRRAA